MPDERIVLEAADLGRAWRRVAHEIAEANAEGSSLMLVGIQRGGVALAQQLSETLAGLYGHPVATGSVEPGLHRDDLSQRGMSELRPTQLPGDLAGQTVVLVDDVLSTGRTVRASIDALMGFGRPKCIRLAVLIDRGHRELQAALRQRLAAATDAAARLEHIAHRIAPIATRWMGHHS